MKLASSPAPTQDALGAPLRRGDRLDSNEVDLETTRPRSALIMSAPPTGALVH